MEDRSETDSMTPMSQEIIDLMLNNLLNEAGNLINTKDLPSHVVIKDEEIEDCSFPAEVKEEHKVQQLAASVVKIEPEWDHFEIEYISITNFIHKQDQPEPQLIVLLERIKTEKHEELIWDVSDKSGTALVGREDISPNHREALIKTATREAINEVEPMYANLDDWKIKHEEIEIKEEFLEPYGTSNSSSENKSTTDTVYQCLQGDNQPTNNCNLPRQLKPINSDYCDYKTVHKGLKKCLLKRRNTEKADMFKCNRCDYQTKWKSDLKRHLLRHASPEEINMLKCDKCDYQTIWKHYLKSHQLGHANPGEIKMFKCDQCDYQTKRKRNLKVHLLKHANSKELKCDQCEYQAIWKMDLKMHLLSHTKEVYKFKCDQCDYQTFFKNSLKEHLKCHKNPDEIEKFKCDQCKFQSIWKHNLKKHLLRHTKSVTMLKYYPKEFNKFKCDKCDYQTIWKYCLNNHLFRHANQMKLLELGEMR